jgi:hypothetical protein
MAKSKTSTAPPAEQPKPRERFTELDGNRSGVLARARSAAALTIPALMPDVGQDENSELPQPYQSLGARGINNLASKLLLSLFPTTTSFFRLTVDEDVMKKFENKAGAKDAIEDALRRRENKTMRHIERGNLRTTLFAALKSLIAIGNTLLFLPKDAPSRTFRLDQYVVLRDPNGRVLETYIKESADPNSIDPEVRTACNIKVEKKKGTHKHLDIYTAIVRRTDGSKMVDYWQEINDIEVPGSRGQCDETENPYLVLRWSGIDGENYGRGHVEEYIGDLRSLEGLAMAIVSFSAIAAKVIFLVHPNATTSIDDLMTAMTGDFVTGALKDIEALQLDKYADFKVSQQVLQDLILRLSHAFLLQSGTVRDAERVTAEEIRQQAQELEDVLGGVYTVMSQELQLPIVRRVIALMERSGDLDKLPKNIGVEPTIVTGFDALDRGHELNRIKQFLADCSQTLGPGFVAYLKLSDLIKKFAIAYNVDIEDFIKTEDEVQQEQQMARAQQTLADAATNAAGPAAGAAVKGYADSVNQQ